MRHWKDGPAPLQCTQCTSSTGPHGWSEPLEATGRGHQGCRRKDHHHKQASIFGGRGIWRGKGRHLRRGALSFNDSDQKE